MLEGKIGLVTGGTSGIGRDASIVMGQHGATVIVSGRRVNAGEETACMVRKSGVKSEFVKADVKNPGDVRSLVEHIVSKYGRLDFAFNNAGVLIDTGKIHESDDSIFDETMAVNVRGLWLSLKEQLRVMVNQLSGAIVNHSSIVGFRGNFNRPAYVTSKHAVIGLTRSAAVDYARKGIRVNAVCPGAVDTVMMEHIDKGDYKTRQKVENKVPLGRYGTGSEVGEAVAWLCSDKASYITGQTFTVDGGITAS